MDATTACELIALNNRFYEENAASFSATRGTPWQGWRRCLDIVLDELAAGGSAVAECTVDAAARGVAVSCPPTLRVLDVACGNLRFEGYLARELPGIALECFAVDSCAALARAEVEGAASALVSTVRFRELDVLACLAEVGSGASVDELACRLTETLDVPPCDLAVCFGFMHHIPLPAWRAAVLRALVSSVRPGGLACVSFWRFLDDERLARKAEEAMGRAKGDRALARLTEAFGPGDRLLGWQDRATSFRYCHGFAKEEVDDLAAQVGDRALPVARFRADGTSGMLNEYLVVRSLPA